MKIFTTIMLVLFSSPIFAVEVSPYKEPRVSVEEWNNYHKAIFKELEKWRKAYKLIDLEIFNDGVTRSSIGFTMSGHDAHPSWVTRYVEMTDGSVYIKVVGYYAGDEKAYRKLFQHYQELANQAQKDLQR